MILNTKAQIFHVTCDIIDIRFHFFTMCIPGFLVPDFNLVKDTCQNYFLFQSGICSQGRRDKYSTLFVKFTIDSASKKETFEVSGFFVCEW